MRNAGKRVFTIATMAILCLVLVSSGGSTATLNTSERETYQATAMGQSTQMGRMFSVNISVEEYSTAEDQQILIAAFDSGGMKGLVNALSKMKSKGRLAITGTLGYEVNYIRSFPTPTGRKIRIVTNRPIRFGEAWADSRSMDYNLSALELDISNEKDKNSGILLPACQFKIDKDKHLAIENYQNPWKLVDVQQR